MVNRRRRILFAVATGISLVATAAQAGDGNVASIVRTDAPWSDAWINQAGSGNTASIVQQQQESAHAAIEQLGDGNIASISQGPDYNGPAFNANAEINQLGSYNTAIIENVNTYARIEQHGLGFGPGNSNFAEVLRDTPMGSPVGVWQEGDGNSAHIKQGGVPYYTTADVSQIGNANGASIDQIHFDTYSVIFGVLEFHSIIDQNGDGNNATIWQASQRTFMYGDASIVQYGSYNSAHISADGPSRIEQRGLGYATGNYNSAEITDNTEVKAPMMIGQEGDFNAARIYRDGGDFSMVGNGDYIDQAGYRNFADINQTSPFQATASISQHGDDNSAVLAQSRWGESAIANIGQLGSNNIAYINQSGGSFGEFAGSATASIDQIGNGHSAYISQNATDGSAQINQH